MGFIIFIEVILLIISFHLHIIKTVHWRFIPFMSTSYESRKIKVIFSYSFHILLILGCSGKRKKGKKEKGRQTIGFLHPPVNP